MASNVMDFRGNTLLVSKVISDNFTGALTGNVTGDVTGNIVDAGVATTVTISFAAGTADGDLDVTITVKDAAGNTVTGVHSLDFWVSESSIGAGLTADAGGTLTATTGTVLDEHTDDKHATILTGASGVAVLVYNDTTDPQDQYFCVKNPSGSGIVVSAVTAVSWGTGA